MPDPRQSQDAPASIHYLEEPDLLACCPPEADMAVLRFDGEVICNLPPVCTPDGEFCTGGSYVVVPLCDAAMPADIPVGGPAGMLLFVALLATAGMAAVRRKPSSPADGL